MTARTGARGVHWHRVGRWICVLALLGAAQCGSCHGRASKGGASGGAAATALGGGPAAAPGKAGSAFTAPATAAQIRGYPVPQAVSRVALAKSLPRLDPGSALASKTGVPVANTSVSVELLGASRHRVLPGAVAPAGEAYVVLDTKWTNVHPQVRVRKSVLEHKRDATMGVGALGSGSAPGASKMVLADVAYEVPHFVDHAYLLADGVAYPMARAGAGLVDAAPRAKAFLLDRKGDSRQLRFAFLVPAKSTDLAFRFFDYANGTVAFPVAGDPGKAVGDGQPPPGAIAQATMKRIDLAVASVAKAASADGVRAPKGWHFVRVGLAGKSLSIHGKTRDIVQIDPRQYLWVVTDHGTVRYGAGGTVNGHGVLRFTPEVWERETAIFLVPDGEKVVTLAVRDGGAVTHLAIGKGTVPPLPAGAATGKDGKVLDVRIVSLWRGETESVLSLAVKNRVSKEGVVLDPLQFPIDTKDGPLSPDASATSGLLHRPPTPFVVPPGGSLRFSLAYETRDLPTQLAFQGTSAKVDIGLVKVPAPANPPRRGTEGYVGEDLVGAEVESDLEAETPTVAPAGEVVTGPQAPASTAKDVAAAFSHRGVSHADARTLPADQWVHGVFQKNSSGDEQAYRLEVSTPGIYRIDAIGPNVEELAYQVDVHHSVSRSAAHGHAILYDLFLADGPQYFSVTSSYGKKGPYRLKATSLGKAPRWGEHEPNDRKTEAEPLPLGQPRTGRIPDKDDEDFYRLSIDVRAHVRIALQSPPGQQGFFYLRRVDASTTVEAQHPGEASVWDGWLWPGEYLVDVHAEAPSLKRYRLEATIADPFQVAGDLEPDDDEAHARPMPKSLTVSGTCLADSDDDVFRLPVLERPTVATVTVVPKDVEVQVENGKHGIDTIHETDTGIEQYWVPASKHLYLQVSPSGAPYRVSIRFADGPRPQMVRPLPVKLSLPKAPPVPAAWIAATQHFTLPVTLTSRAQAPLTVHLRGWTSHPGWHLSVPATATLTPGKAVTVQAQVVVDPQAWGDHPVSLVVGASDDAGDHRIVTARIQPRCGAEPVGPGAPFPVPPALRGGLDVAETRFGAVPVAKTGNARESLDHLFDGEADLDNVWYGEADSLPLTVTVRLAGNGPVPVAGVLLTPVIHQADVESARRFDLLFSTDGKHFTHALSGTLHADGTEQAFVLDHPVLAHFARLVVRSGIPLGIQHVGLSEMKVVAVPGKAGGDLDAFDLASPKLGGHVAWMTSMPLSRAGLKRLLDEKDNNRTFTVDPVNPNRFAVGFWQGRSAQIDRLEWRDPKRSDMPPRMPWVLVSVSDAGPAGPWKALGKWTFNRDATGLAVWKLDHPVWARYVRFTLPPPKGKQTSYTLPDTIRIFERPQTGGYLSILGEWGLYDRAAIHEALVPPPAPPTPGPVHDTRKTALALTAGVTHADSVERGVDLDWYTIAVPAHDNHLSFRVGTTDQSRVSLRLEDPSGREVPVHVAQVVGADLVDAKVKGGETYAVRVAEPERNVVFTWDTSGSVSDYIPLINGAVRAYARQVRPGRERVGLRLFEGAELVPGLSDDPHQLATFLDAGQWVDPESSNGQLSLANAATDLDRSRGSRAIMIITDADSTGYQDSEQLWSLLDTVHPQVFAEQIQVGDHPQYQQSLMQDWAGVNHGHYSAFGSETGLDLGFNQASCMLRRPAIYRITATPSYEAPPLPGRIKVSGPAARRTSFELILDASGSMMSRLGHSTRIGVARHVLERLVTHQLPKGTPVALRVYGQRVPRACRTDLVVPLSPLKPRRMVRRIAHVVPQDRSGTPIAASLLDVAKDLRHAHGTKIVLLVTDGGESCHGDPAKAIRTLKAKGFDVRLNIVGFTIKNKTVQRAYKDWAALAGGRFFDAANEKDLSRAVAASLRPTYQVVDADGDVVGHGSVGGKPVSVKPGTYSVRVLTSPVQTVSGVQVLSRLLTPVKLGAHGR